MKFKNSITIVSGGSRGIGLDIAKKFLAEESEVFVLDLIEPNQEETNFKSNFNYISCDLSEEKSILSALSKIELANDKKIYLINNARFKSNGYMNESLDDWNKSLSIGLTAPFILSKQIIKKSRCGGSIINICSIAAKYATNESPSYHAAKGGLLALTKYLAVHGAKKSFRANAILPGLIVQDEHKEKFFAEENRNFQEISEAYQPMRKVGSEADVSNLAMFLCSDQSSYLSGTEIILDGASTSKDHFSLLYDYSIRK